MWKFPKIENTKTRKNSASFVVFSGLSAPKSVWYMKKQSLSTETSTDRCEKLNKENTVVFTSHALKVIFTVVGLNGS